MSNCFILLAAGKGKRFKSNILKQFINYKNKPLFMHSIDKATKSNLFKEIVLVTNNKINLKIPFVLFHGLKDAVVPLKISKKILKIFFKK